MERTLLDSISNPLGNFRSYVNHVGTKRYYSSTDAIISFKGVELEEVVAIQWQINEPKQPLYGYNSWTFDEVAVGARIVQGTFIINFIIPDYLNRILTGAEGTDDTKIIYKNDGTKKPQDRHKKYFPNCFTIDIGFGKKDKDAITGDRPHIFLDSVFVQSAETLCDQNGSPVMESYAFVARDRDFSR